MTVDYRTYLDDFFIGDARIWYGTPVPISASDLSGAQMAADSGFFLGLTKRGDVVRVSFRTKLAYYTWEGDLTPQEAKVVEEEMTIQASCATLYGANGLTVAGLLSGGRFTSGTFGSTSGGNFAHDSVTVIGTDLRSDRLCVVSMYKHTCEEYAFDFSPDNLTTATFTLKGLTYLDEEGAVVGIGKIFYVDL